MLFFKSNNFILNKVIVPPRHYHSHESRFFVCFLYFSNILFSKSNIKIKILRPIRGSFKMVANPCTFLPLWWDVSFSPLSLVGSMATSTNKRSQKWGSIDFQGWLWETDGFYCLFLGTFSLRLPGEIWISETEASLLRVLMRLVFQRPQDTNTMKENFWCSLHELISQLSTMGTSSDAAREKVTQPSYACSLYPWMVRYNNMLFVLLKSYVTTATGIIQNYTFYVQQCKYLILWNTQIMNKW